jgi:hypothetical protein
MPPAKLKTFDTRDKITDNKSRLNQLIDIVSADLATDLNRRKYAAFFTGSTTPVTSSLFNTIFDQDHTLQSSNALLDITFGTYATTVVTNGTSQIQGSTIVTSIQNKSIDSSGKYFFPSGTSLMMREKINIYKQYAQSLLGNANSTFKMSYQTPSSADPINEALFINFKRLFKRDNIAKGTFGLKLYNRLATNTDLDHTSATIVKDGTLFNNPNADTEFIGRSFLTPQATQDSATWVENQVIILDTNASVTYNVLPTSGEVATLKMYLDSTTSVDVGLIFYDAGVIVLDVHKVFDLNTLIQGVIQFPDTDAAPVNFKTDENSTPTNILQGEKALGTIGADTTLKQFLQLATIDDIVRHFCKSRFANNATTCISFENETIINSTIFFCNAATNEFNYSTNPTYVDEIGKINVVSSTTDQPFSYITTVGLYDVSNNLLAVAKLSRPVEKNPSNNLTIRVRLDY